MQQIYTDVNHNIITQEPRPDEKSNQTNLKTGKSSPRPQSTTNISRNITNFFGVQDSQTTVGALQLLMHLQTHLRLATYELRHHLSYPLACFLKSLRSKQCTQVKQFSFFKLKRCSRQNHQFPVKPNSHYIYVYIFAGRENSQLGQNASLIETPRGHLHCFTSIISQPNSFVPYFVSSFTCQQDGGN